MRLRWLLMRKGRPKYPQPRDVGPVVQALQWHIPMDGDLIGGMRESLKHVPNYRVKSQTNEIEWFVDIYRGSFYHVSVADSTEICKTIPSLVSYLWLKLGIKRAQ
jgi:hypothetical protein